MVCVQEVPEPATLPGASISAGEKAAVCGRPVRADIDLSAVAANTRALVRIVGPDVQVMAVVKANGYGLGARQIARAALDGGATWLGVACLDEGVELRQAGFTCPILVMSYVPPEEAGDAVRFQLTVVLHHERTARDLEAAAASQSRPHESVGVHVKVDTGLGRYGASPDDFLPLLQALRSMPHLRVEGAMTHFADADDLNSSFAAEQVSRFRQLLQEAEREGFTFPLLHAANSAGTLALPDSRFNMVRSGILLSGNLPAPGLKNRISLIPALTLRSRLARVFTVQPGESVGYGRTWRAGRTTRVGLIPFGYADGYLRALSNSGQVLVRGIRCPVIGRVSMDQITIDVTEVPDAQEDDEAVLIGRQGEGEITAAEVAEWAGTIPYEILCALSARVPRRYVYQGEVVEECTLLGLSSAPAGGRVEKERNV